MKKTKSILLIFGITIIAILLVISVFQGRKISWQYDYIKLNTPKNNVVLEEYKNNVSIVQSKSDCKTLIDSLINNSKYLK
jgi:hypothetical protein